MATVTVYMMVALMAVASQKTEGKILNCGSVKTSSCAAAVGQCRGRIPRCSGASPYSCSVDSYPLELCGSCTGRIPYSAGLHPSYNFGRCSCQAGCGLTHYGRSIGVCPGGVSCAYGTPCSSRCPHCSPAGSYVREFHPLYDNCYSGSEHHFNPCCKTGHTSCRELD